MLHLLVISFILVLLANANTFSAYIINILYPTKALKESIIATRIELKQTSAQDAFAKWAKLKRQLEKSHKEYQQILLKNTLAMKSLSWGCYILSWIFYVVVFFYYRNVALFYMPKDILGPVGDYLAACNWPFSPVGSCGVFYVLYAGCSVFGRLYKQFKL